MKNIIKENLVKLQKAEQIADQAETKYEEEPENLEAESAFEKAYKEELDLYMLVSRQLSEFSGIDEKTARAIVKTKRNELIGLLA